MKNDPLKNVREHLQQAPQMREPNAKLIVYRGLQASGKTTDALLRVKNGHGRIKRLNRDELRSTIDGGDYSRDNEPHIRAVEIMMARYFLSQKFIVAIDDMNLDPLTMRNWEHLAEEMGVALEIVDFTHVSLDVCIQRNRKRDHPVKENIIIDAYQKYILPKVRD